MVESVRYHRLDALVPHTKKHICRMCDYAQEADTILAGADTEDVSFLVVGDPFGCALTVF